MLNSTYYVIDSADRRVLYETDVLSAAVGFVDGCEGRCVITSAVRLTNAMPVFYRLSLIDESTGEVMAESAEMDLPTATEAMFSTTIALLPSRLPVAKGGAR